MTMVPDTLIVAATTLIIVLGVWVANLAIVNRQQKMFIERLKNENLLLTDAYSKLFDNTMRIIDETAKKFGEK